MAISSDRQDVRDAILDASESLLMEVGYAAITTRKLAGRAGVNHGLVHYYFGSMEEVFLQTLERFTRRLVERQREMYAADRPFIEKWRSAMDFLADDSESGYHKVWLELQAMGWNHVDMRDRIQRVHSQWIDVVTAAFDEGMTELGIDRRQFPLRGLVALVVTFNQGVILERTSGVDSGHRELLRMIDRVLDARARA